MNKSDDIDDIVFVVKGIIAGILIGILIGAYYQLDYQKEELHDVATSNRLLSDGNNIYRITFLNESEYLNNTKKYIKIYQ